MMKEAKASRAEMVMFWSAALVVCGASWVALGMFILAR